MALFSKNTQDTIFNTPGWAAMYSVEDYENGNPYDIDVVEQNLPGTDWYSYCVYPSCHKNLNMCFFATNFSKQYDIPIIVDGKFNDEWDQHIKSKNEGILFPALFTKLVMSIKEDYENKLFFNVFFKYSYNQQDYIFIDYNEALKEYKKCSYKNVPFEIYISQDGIDSAFKSFTVINDGKMISREEAFEGAYYEYVSLFLLWTEIKCLF